MTVIVFVTLEEVAQLEPLTFPLSKINAPSDVLVLLNANLIPGWLLPTGPFVIIPLVYEVLEGRIHAVIVKLAPKFIPGLKVIYPPVGAPIKLKTFLTFFYSHRDSYNCA